ncbi:MAG TPA: A/G-specific adenine glycosylase [Caulobacteraceae bacterium]|jgi:A/G-specific adenine glycosylase|nr:A/G-specific adenine glycosylase [Caulobacteraceae bacterium]
MAKTSLRARLLDWYDAHARVLPWRVSPAARARGERADPYRVWLSEVMLQQTTVPHATAYFLKFLERWPQVQALAAAADDQVMAAWAGLGYYARARNLLACARAVAGAHGGVFPASEEALRSLPGVGGYTAAAVAAIAFDQPANVVDGNVERVVARLYAVETPLPAAKPEITRLAAGLAEGPRPGDWAQALMDLGAMVCRPKAPLCDRCPLSRDCQALAGGAPETYPRRAKKPDRPRRRGAVFVLTRGGKAALVRRPPKGLLGGMLGLPTTDWRATAWAEAEALAATPAPASWRCVGEIEHTFTHFSLTLDVYRAEGSAPEPDLVWLPFDRALAETPSVFGKALRLAL